MCELFLLTGLYIYIASSLPTMELLCFCVKMVVEGGGWQGYWSGGELRELA